MTMLSRSLTVFACAALLSACSAEPYPMDHMPEGEFPDDDADYEADLAYRGHEMHEPDEPRREPRPWTKEALEEFHASNKHGKYTDDIGILGSHKKPKAALPAPPAAASAPANQPRAQPATEKP